jgi:tetratricopeptide (TPR) repeat protein
MISSEDARAPVRVVSRDWRWWLPAFALAGASLVALVAIARFHRQHIEARTGTPCPMDRAAIEEAFKRHAVDPGPWVALLIPDERASRFAREVAGGTVDAEGKSAALMAGVRKLFDDQTLARASLAETRDAEVRTPSELLTAAGRKGSSLQVYPLELAALVTAGLRSLGVEAMVTEVLRAAGERALPDPSGLIGYYAVTYAGADGTWHRLDPWQGANLPEGARTEVVSDTAAVGAAMALSALDAAIFRMDTERALRLSGDALALAGHLPTVRSARGVVVLGAHMAEQALQELEAARQLRPDAARMHNAATVYLLLGDNDRADALLAQAIDAAPELAAAYVTRAALFEARHEGDAAAAALARAEELAPSLGTLQLALAERDLRFGMPDEALARAARAVNERPAFDARLRLAMLQRQAARYAAMRANAQAILAGTPAYRRDEVRDILRVALGPTALEVVEELESGPAVDASTPASDDLAAKAIPTGP